VTQQRGRRALALDNGVGRQRGAVDDQRQIGRLDAALGEDRVDPREHAFCGRRRSRQDLAAPAPRPVFEHAIGERAADIGGEARTLAHSLFVGMLSWVKGGFITRPSRSTLSSQAADRSVLVREHPIANAATRRAQIQGYFAASIACFLSTNCSV
jgi:hypothetical protein